jgi:hypothetical protein
VFRPVMAAPFSVDSPKVSTTFFSNEIYDQNTSKTALSRTYSLRSCNKCKRVSANSLPEGDCMFYLVIGGDAGDCFLHD